MSRKGESGFESFYGAAYGERWPRLRSALTSEVRQVARLNAFAGANPVERGFAPDRIKSVENVRYLKWEGAEPGPAPVPDAQGLMDIYWMDLASVFPPLALGVEPGHDVLDLCAAPGGKSLILAERLAGRGWLVANEFSDKRAARLRRVLREYIPQETREALDLKVTSRDGSRWCLHETEAFDRILLDAPCSGERHLLNTPSELKLWSPARSKNLAVRQYALLASALLVARVGGRIVYSTCSISPFENDAVIARLLKKKGDQVAVRPLALPIGEATEHGWMILPDATGYGPIYLAALERTGAGS